MKYWWMIGCMMWASLVTAQTTTFPPGEYITDEGWGIMNLEPAVEGRQSFNIETQGKDGHQCALGGKIEQGKAVLKNNNNEHSCTISFNLIDNGIEVAIKADSFCATYCGGRAWFDGVYNKPAPGCDSGSISKAQAGFEELYANGQFAEAEQIFASVLDHCQEVLFWSHKDWMLNELARAQASQGKGVECTTTLQPLAEDAAKPDEALCTTSSSKPRLLPVDCDVYQTIMESVRTTLEGCRSMPAYQAAGK